MPISLLSFTQQIGNFSSTLGEKLYQFIPGKHPSPRRVDCRTAAAWSTQHIFGHNPCSSLKWQSTAYIYTNRKSPLSLFPSNTSLYNVFKKEYPEVVDIEIRLSKELSSDKFSTFSPEYFFTTEHGFTTYYGLNVEKLKIFTENFKKILEEITQAPVPTHVKNRLMTMAVQVIPFSTLEFSISFHISSDEQIEIVKNFLINNLKEWRKIASQQPDASPILNNLLKKSYEVEENEITIDDFNGELLYSTLKIIPFIIKHIGPSKPFWNIMEECGLVIPSTISPYNSVFLGNKNPINNDKIQTPLGHAIINKIIPEIAQHAASLVSPQYPFLKVAEDLGLFIRGKWTVPRIQDLMGLEIVHRIIETVDFNNPFWKIVKDWGLKNRGGPYIEKPLFSPLGNFFGKLLAKDKWVIPEGCLDYLYYKLLSKAAETVGSTNDTCNILTSYIEGVCLREPGKLWTSCPADTQIANAKPENLPQVFFQNAQKLGIFDDKNGNWVIPTHVLDSITMTIIAHKQLYFENLYTIPPYLSPQRR